MPDEVWYSSGRTINIGNFNSVKPDAGYRTQIRPGETPAQAMTRAYEFVEKVLRSVEQKIMEENPK